MHINRYIRLKNQKDVTLDLRAISVLVWKLLGCLALLLLCFCLGLIVGALN